MLQTFASTAMDDAAIGVDRPAGEDGLARELTAQIRAAFPALRFSNARVEERGGDHRVLLLDAAYAFRFPRETTHDLSVEISVLRALRGRCDIAVPEYALTDPAGRFAGYPFIAGEELTPRRFALLPIEVRHHVLDQAGRFLAVLHGLPPETILPAARWPRLAPVAEQVAHAREHCLPAIARAFPPLARLLDTFCEGGASDAAGHEVVLHGDLVDDHILLAPDGQRLAGIIDFGDVALGEPAHDLLGFWVYGREAVARVIAAYGAGGDRRLQERSLRAFVRYRIDRFADLLAAEGRAVAGRSLAGLSELVSFATSDPAVA